uniref:Phosducin-like protein n=1 Tax=Cacopsylla melanoneura TaxID=428564 RepID=A0A8D8M4R4_9HEMI
MATLEDKILGDPRENYCSSSEESGHEDSDIDEGSDEGAMGPADPTPAPPPVKEWNGTASNTGPKGVLNDWEQFKAYESQARRDKDERRAIQMSKLALTCASAEEEAKRKAQEDEEKRRKEELEEELRELEQDDEFLFDYQKKKMKQLYERLITGGERERKTFGE